VFFISNSHANCPVNDDENHRTLAYVSTVGKKDIEGSMTEKVKWVGAEVAKKAKLLKLSKLSLTVAIRLYHGRVKALAEAARNEGLEF